MTDTLSGFLVPNAGFDAKLGVVTYEGDDQLTGDSLSWNGTALSDALNPANNFFNGTRSRLGVAVSNTGDLPQLTGGARSMSGMDLDVVDVTSRVSQGQTSATITASTNLDFYLLGAFVTSISTYKPDFSGATKTVADLNQPPERRGVAWRYHRVHHLGYQRRQRQRHERCGERRRSNGIDIRPGLDPNRVGCQRWDQNRCRRRRPG